jgi:hypothetical protein
MDPKEPVDRDPTRAGRRAAAAGPAAAAAAAARMSTRRRLACDPAPAAFGSIDEWVWRWRGEGNFKCGREWDHEGTDSWTSASTRRAAMIEKHRRSVLGRGGGALNPPPISTPPHTHAHTTNTQFHVACVIASRCPVSGRRMIGPSPSDRSRLNLGTPFLDVCESHCDCVAHMCGCHVCGEGRGAETAPTLSDCSALARSCL